MSTVVKMSVARRAEIKKAVDRTRAFREWITENVPKANINLNVWLQSGTGRDLSTAPLSGIISCGTIGCLGGWADIYFRETKCHMLAHIFFGGNFLYPKGIGDTLFSPAHSNLPHLERDDRRACLRRLDKRVEQLQRAARKA